MDYWVWSGDDATQTKGQKWMEIRVCGVMESDVIQTLLYTSEPVIQWNDDLLALVIWSKQNHCHHLSITLEKSNSIDDSK